MLLLPSQRGINRPGRLQDHRTQHRRVSGTDETLGREPGAAVSEQLRS